MDPVALLLFATEVVKKSAKAKVGPGKANTAPVGDEAEQQALRQLHTCHQLIESMNCGGQPFLETERRLMVDTVHELQTALRIDLTQSLRRLLSTNVVPRSLHLTHAPGCLPFDSVGAKCEFQVRAGGYLSSAKKSVSESALFVQRAIQVLHSDNVQTHVARRAWCALPRTEAEGAFLVLNYILPGSPRIHVVCTYAASPDALAAIREAHEAFRQHQLAARGASHHRRHHHSLFAGDGEGDAWRGWRGLLARLFVGHTAAASAQQQPDASGGDEAAAAMNLAATEVDEDFANARLKLIPTMVEANWAVKMAVGQRPALLGTKLPLRYFKGRNYVEVDIDVSSSAIATGIMGMVTGLSRHMVVDLGWTLQGEADAELPERVLCQTRFHHVDLEAGAEVE